MGAVGCSLGMMFAATAYITHKEALAEQRIERLRHRYEAALGEQSLALATAQNTSNLAQTCLPVVKLAQNRQSDIAKLQGLLAEFPSFKTEQYKVVAKKVEEEIARQTQESDGLVAALEDPQLRLTRCVFATQPASAEEAPIWKSGKLLLSAAGWREAN